MISDSIPVFLNGHPVWMPSGSTLGQLILREDADLAAALDAGSAQAADARGIAVPPDTLLSAGAIFRVIRSARDAGAALDA